MERILIVATGGTFDKQYDEIAGELSFSINLR
jgi:L-asparaginase/Glu-tRNA(Gln) amidotransferase subunit D